MPTGNNLVQRAFTQQAEAYATNPLIKDAARIEKLVHAVRPFSDARVLDVATGPGYVATAFTKVCNITIGIDLTQAPLSIAEGYRRNQRIAHLYFVSANAQEIPFGDGAFDIVVSRFAFHHFEQPLDVLAEMARVCKPNGLIAVEDLITSEHRKRAAYQNKIEKLRDASHAAILPISQFLLLFTSIGLDIVHLETDALVQNAGRWLINAHTPEAEANEVRKLLEKDAQEDLSGVQPFYDLENHLYFTQHTATFVMRRLMATSDK